MPEDLSNLGDLGILAHDGLLQLLNTACQQLLNFLLQERPDRVDQLLGLGLFLFGLADLVALEELDEVRELEFLLP